MITYRCKDHRGRYYVGAPHRMTKRERLLRRNWQTAEELVGSCVHGKWMRPDVPRMVAEQVGAVVVRNYDGADARQRAEARGEVRALEAVLGLLPSASYNASVARLLTNAKRRAGVK